MNTQRIAAIATAAILTLSLVTAAPTLAAPKKDEDLKYLNDIAEKNAIDRFTNSDVKIRYPQKVTFKGNGGKFTVSSGLTGLVRKVTTTSKKVTWGGKLGKSPTVTRAGYTFAGWYTSKVGGKKVSKTTKITKKATYYARWTAKPKTPSPTVQPTVAPTAAPTAQPTVAPTATPIPTATVEELQFAGSTWLVLETKTDGSKFVLSKDIFELRAYNDEWEEVTWETSTIRAYLNGEGFWDKLSLAEQARVKTTTVINSDNPQYNTSGGNDTQDKIFLLSLRELLETSGSDYSKINGTLFNDDNNDLRVAKYDGTASWWWLRSPGSIAEFASCVNFDGIVYVNGYNVSIGVTRGIRPALWLAA